MLHTATHNQAPTGPYLHTTLLPLCWLLTLNSNMISDTKSHHLLTLITLSLPAICYGFIFLRFLLKQLSSIDANSATDTFCSTLISCLDTICPLSSRPARSPTFAHFGCLTFSANIANSKFRAAERVWHKSQNVTDLIVYQSLLSSFSANVSTAKSTYYHIKINNASNSRMLFKTFSSLLCPPPPPLHLSTLTADDFATFFIYEINLSSTSYQQTYTLLNPSLHSLNSSFPVILLLVRLILFHLISIKLFLLQLFLHSLTSLTHPFTLVFFPQHLNRLV